MYMYIYMCIYIYIYIRTCAIHRTTSFLKNEIQNIQLRKLKMIQQCKYKQNYPFSTDFTNSLFSCLHLLIKSDFYQLLINMDAIVEIETNTHLIINV